MQRIFYHMMESIRNHSLYCKEILLVFCAFFLPGILLGQTAPDPSAFERVWWHAAVLITGLPQIGLLIFILRLHPDHDPIPFGLRAPRLADLPIALAVLAAVIAVLIGTSFVVALIPDAAHAAATDFRWSFTRPALIPLVFLTSVVTGYREEIFFRSYLLTRLEQMDAPRPAAIAVSTLLFASGHLYQGWSGFAVAALLGVLFAVVFLRRRNLHAIAWGHALYNMVALIGGSLIRNLVSSP
ncbi:MAG: CPBP family intramembrane metalloprotease [Spirochaetaceae bacterium]|nr:MAG: CPBP family intramembrane metalloprotease [Spirochaetaceae bacterium]